MFRFIKVSVTFVICVLTFVLPTGGNADNARQVVPIRVGVSLPFTGGYANFGDAGRIGLELGLEDLAVKPVELFYEDNQGASAAAVTGLTKLLNLNQIQVLFVLSSSATAAVLPIAQQRGLPVFAWTGSPKLTAGKPNALRLMSAGQDQGKFMLNEARRRGYKKIAFISMINEYAQAVREGFLQDIKPDELTMAEEVAPEASDLRTLGSKIRTSNTTAVGACVATPQFPVLMRQLREQGFRGPIFGCHSMSSQDIARFAGDQGNESWFVEGHTTSAFEARFAKRSSDSSGLWVAGVFYDLALLMGEFAAEGKPANELITSLRGKCWDKSAFGHACFRETAGDAFLDVPLGVTTFKNGGFVRSSP